MKIDPRSAQALLAVLDGGSFEAAARALHLTPSAISQRLRALELSLGTPLLLRTRPCRATPAGNRLALYLRRAKLLDDEFLADWQGGEPPRLSVVLNNDTLATWLLPALADFLLKEQVLLEVLVDDQDHTYALFEAGRAMAAISSQSQAMRGCVAERLGIMRYRLCAAPAFAQRWFSQGLQREAARQAPLLVFDRKDALQAEFLLKHLGLPAGAYPCHYLPASDPFLQAIKLGLGYGMLPEQQYAEPLAQGSLVDLAPGQAVDVHLYWHRWKVQSPTLERLSRELLDQARLRLRA